MSKGDDKTDEGEPVVPMSDFESAQPMVVAEEGTPEQLGFDLRFEGGSALLALENCTVVEGVVVRTALFEVPDVSFPLDLSGGAERFIDKRLKLRAADVTLDFESLFQPEKLSQVGVTLLRHRSRSGGIEMMCAIEGPTEPVRVRARGAFVPAGHAGLAVVLHEVVPFGVSHRPRYDVAQALLSAIELPGGRPARGLVRRADVLRALFSTLLPSFGWKVPAVDDVRVHEALLGRGHLSIRAFSGDKPDGWKRIRTPRRESMQSAVVLAGLADDLAGKDAAGQLAVVDALIDSGAPPAAVPFLAEIVRKDERRQREADEVVEAAFKTAPQHIGVLSARVEAFGLDADERAERLSALGRVAEDQDEAWVSAQAHLSAAHLFTDVERNTDAAGAAFAADPTLGEAGLLFTERLIARGDDKEALRVAKTVIERIDDEEREQLCVRLAPVAHRVDGPAAAKTFLRRALRKSDRPDALFALVRLHIAEGELSAAAELMARLLAAQGERATDEERVAFHLLSAELSEARDERPAARSALAQAQRILPDNIDIAVSLSTLFAKDGDLDAAIDTLVPLLSIDPITPRVATAAARHYVARADEGDAKAARALLMRVPAAEHDAASQRLLAQAEAKDGAPEALARLFLSDAEAASTGEAQADHFFAAGTLFLDGGDGARAAETLARAVRADALGVKRAAALVVERDDLALVSDLASNLADAPVLLRALADRCIEAPAAAHRLLVPSPRTEDALKRAELASLLDDTSLVRSEIDTALELLRTEAEPGEAERDLLAQKGRLLAEREPQVAAEAFEQAHARGADVADAWLGAALAAGEVKTVARAVVATGAAMDTLGSDVLRELVASDVLEDATAARQAHLTLANRVEDETDAEAYVAFLAAQASPERAAELERLSALYQRAEWYLAALALFERKGEGGAFLGRADARLDDDAFASAPVVRAVFELAVRERDADRVLTVGAQWCRVAAGARDELADALRARYVALADLDEDKTALALDAWLAAFPAATEALAARVPSLLAEGESRRAIAVLQSAADAGGDDISRTVVELSAVVADHAQASTDLAAEVGALSMWLVHADEDHPETTVRLQRVVQLDVAEERFAAAADRLDELIDRIPAGERTASAVQLAELCTGPLGDTRRAARAYEVAVEDDSESIELSVAYAAVLESSEEWLRYAAELKRRSALLPPGENRIAVLLALGDVYAERLGRDRDAEHAWLHATRTAPFSEPPLARLMTAARGANNHRLRVRAHLAAAHALGEGKRAAGMAEEAGALLAGILLKPRLAVAAYRFAAAQSDNPAPSHRALIELFRAIGDADNTLLHAEAFVALQQGEAHALGLELIADVYERMLDNPAEAARTRKAALLENPTQRTSALALERYLRSEGETREALDVRKRYSDAAETPDTRAQTYAYLAEVASSELGDAELATSLAETALEANPRLQTLRLKRIDLLRGLGRHDEAVAELSVLVAGDELEPDEAVGLLRRKARAEQDDLHDMAAARKTLREAHRRFPRSDLVVDDLVNVEVMLGEPAHAAAALTRILDIYEEGTEALGSRRVILERIASLLEDAGDEAGALAVLDEAAPLGKLSHASEYRRARLAERRGEFATATASLTALLDDESIDAEERVALLGRLGLAAERAERHDVALSAWVRRAERVPNDAAAWRRAESLATGLGDLETARRASDALLHLEDGTDDERLARTLWVARDMWRREQNPDGAALMFGAARELLDEEGLRAEHLACLREADDRDAARHLITEREGQGDLVDADELLFRAQVRIDADADPEGALDDVLKAMRLEGAPSDALTEQIALGAPTLVATALLTEDLDPVRLYAFADALDVAAVDQDVLSQLADAFPARPQFARVAIDKERDADPLRAADRLIALGQGEGGVEDLADAAHLLVLADVDVSALLGRLDALGPQWGADPDLRKEALRRFRDAEAWPAVVAVLEHGIAAADDAAMARALRLETVAVLRDGLEDHRRAADHLRVLLDANEDDRAAWGEYLETLEELEEQTELASALKRRLDLVEGTERHELARRRAEVLLGEGRGEEALDDLVSARRDADDAGLKALEAQIHAATGDDALAAHLAAELALAPTDDDAATLLTLTTAVPAHDRARAGAVRLGAGIDAAVLVEGAVAYPGRHATELGAELAALCQLAPAAEGALLAAIVPALAGLPVPAALAAAAPLREGAGPLRAPLALDTVARRRRSEGAGAALDELDAWALQGSAADHLRFRLHARRGDYERAFSALEEVAPGVQQALRDRYNAPQAEGAALEAVALRGIRERACDDDAVIAMARAGHTARFQLRFERLDPATRGAMAGRVCALAPAAERIEIQLAAQRALPANRRADALRSLVQFCERESDAAAEAHGLAELIALGGASADEVIRRATLAVALGEKSATRHALAAANAAPNAPGLVALLKSAVELSVKQPERDPDIDDCLLAWVDAAAADSGSLDDVLAFAQAMRRPRVVNAVLGRKAATLDDRAERAEALLEQADHAARTLHDATRAFSLLKNAAALAPDADYLERAYQLAASEGLTDSLAEVVDDDLARGGLLALVGEVRSAKRVFAALGTLPALYARAELARNEGDTDEERSVLYRIVDRDEASPESRRRLVEMSASAGDATETVRQALAFLREFYADDRVVEALAVALDDAPDDVASDALEVIRAFFSEPGHGQTRAGSLLIEAWSRASARAGSPADAIAALKALAEQRDDDASWGAYLRRVADADDALALRDAALRLKARPVLLGEVAAVYPAAAALALSALRGDDALQVILAAALERAPHAAPLRQLQIDNFESIEAWSDAARALSALPASDVETRRDQLRRAAELAEKGGDDALAHACLLSVPLSVFDASTRDVALRVAESVGPAAIPLLVRIAASTDAQDDIDRALFAATRTDDDAMACAVAAWRLRQAPRDKVARSLAAGRGANAAQAFFGGHLALEGTSPMPASPAADFKAAFALKSREVTPREDAAPVETALQRARFGGAAVRRGAWQEMAEAGTEAGHHLDAARCLLRSGASLDDAPIDLRLAADPSLADRAVRTTVIAGRLLGGDAQPKERTRLLALFSDLDDQGYAGAELRQDVYGEDGGAAALIDREDTHGDAAIFGAIRELSPFARVAERSTLAALAASRGAVEVAAALNPALVPATPALPMVAELSKRMAAAQKSGDAQSELSLRLLTIGALGTDADAEKAIANLATRLKNYAVLDASLARQVALYGRSESPDEAQQGELYKRRADILSRHLKRPRESLAAMALAVARLPDDHDALRLWVDVAEANGTLDDRLAAYSAQEATLVGDAQERSRLRRVDLLQEVGRHDDALDVLSGGGAKGESAPPSEAVLKARGQILLDMGKPVAAADAYLAAAPLGEDVDARAALYGRAADVLYDAGERERAIAALLDAAGEGHTASLMDAEAKARALGAHAALNRVLTVKYRIDESLETRRDVALERAHLLTTHLDNRQEAIGVLEEQAVADPNDLGARLALAEWYLEDRRLLDAALAYESAASIPDLPAVAVAAPAREAASLLSALGDLERAGPLAERALGLGVVDVKVLAVAAAFHRSHGAHQRVDELLAQELDMVGNVRDKAHLWMERAHLRKTELGDADGARKALHRVLELAPDHPAALEMMEVVARENESFGALRAALSQAVDHTEDVPQKVQWLRRIAQLDDEQFHDLRAAEASIDRALELAPDNADLLVKKGEFMAKRGHVDGLPAILERAEAAGATTLPGMLQMVRGDALLVAGDTAGAKAAFRSATDDEEMGPTAWDRLIDVFQGEGDAEVLAEALREARRSAHDDERLASLAQQEAAVRAEMGDADGHIGALEAVLAVHPGSTDALRALHELYFKRGRLKRVEPVFAAWADAPEDRVERSRRLSEYAGFLLDELGDEGKARAVFEEALTLDEAEPTALLRLAKIAYDARDFASALPLLDRVETDAWPRGSVDLDFHRAYAAVKLDAVDADDRLRQVLRQDAKHTAALEILAERAIKSGDVPAAEFALHTLSGLVDEREDPLRAAHVNADLAKLHLKQGRGAEAKASAMRALALRPSAPEMLALAADALELAGDFDEAAGMLQRVAALTDDQAETIEVEAKMVALYDMAGRDAKADELRTALFNKTGEARFRPTTPTGLEIDDTIRMPAAPAPEPAADDGVAALAVQVQDLLRDRKHIAAVQLLVDRYSEYGPDSDLAALGISAAQGAEDPASLVFFIEERLKGAKNQSEVVELAGLAGRTYWKELGKPDRAAELMYMAHQSAPENVDVRLELTALYAEIPRLFSHAQTGVLQLLRRVPTDARVFQVGADLAARQKRGERARALRCAALLLNGKSGFSAELVSEIPVPRTPVPALSEVDLQQTLSPDALGEPMGQLLTILSPVLEDIFSGPRPNTDKARRLADVSVEGFAFFEQVDRLLPGRPMRVLIGDVDEIALVPGQLIEVVIPRVAERLGGDVLFAHIARAVALVRLGATLTTLDERRTVPHLFAMLHDAFGDGDRRAAEALTEAASSEMLAEAEGHAEAALAGGIASLRQALDAQRRCADRFALLTSGSTPGAVMAGPIPGLPGLDAEAVRDTVSATPRATELLTFAARDNVWALRERYGWSEER